LSKLSTVRFADLLAEIIKCCDSVKGANPKHLWDRANEVLPMLEQAASHCQKLELTSEANQFQKHADGLAALRHEIAMSLLVAQNPQDIADLVDAFGPFQTPTGNQELDKERQSLRLKELFGSIIEVRQYAASLRKTLRKATSRRSSTDQSSESLTPPQVAKQLGVDPDTVRGWIESRQLKAANVGKGKQRPRYRIRQSDLDAFLKARFPEPQPAKPRRKREPADVIQFIS
jgi:excisionase family DNA binding protein